MEITQTEISSLLDAIKKRRFSIAEAKQIIEDAPAPKEWRDEDTVFSVISDGTSGQDWIERLENQGWEVDDFAKSILLSKGFRPTNGVITEIVLYKSLPVDNIVNICITARKRGSVEPHVEVACLICELFSQREFRDRGIVSIIVMHSIITPNATFDGEGGNLCLVNLFDPEDKKRLSALALTSNSRLNGWAYAFKK